MSAASTPAPRVPNVGASRSHTLFWPMFILLLGIGTLAVYQIMAAEDQLDEVTRAVDKMDMKVKLALHERNLFFVMARDVLAMAPQDPNAEKIAVDFKLRQLKAAQPALFDQATTPAPVDAATSLPGATTNTAPAQPMPASATPPESPSAAPAK